MPTNPEDIELTDAHRRWIARVADEKGISWHAVLEGLITYLERSIR